MKVVIVEIKTRWPNDVKNFPMILLLKLWHYWLEAICELEIEVNIYFYVDLLKP